MSKRKMKKKTDVPTSFRLYPKVLAILKAEAQANYRSLASEIQMRLIQTLEKEGKITRAELE